MDNNIFDILSTPIFNYLLIGLVGLLLILIIYLFSVRRRILRGTYNKEKEVILKQQKILARISFALIYLILVILLLRFLSNITL
ncbi:hypothetical protein C1631_022805 [Chryseobacterium phosphatilyticum]|uniref:Mechanosensitive ion channel protein MscS n=1 Tax=Chryseobacterium phosphatilyticum TaxID=475075 RepID=A0A316WT50_9FLAO|nr:hypothetical protein C1631_022805 [Chryseobacterium phosphatilyticum]